MFMGAAGGIGLGRLVAALFPDSTWVFVGTLAVSLVAGSALGVLSVRTRRTAGLRAHITGLTAEAFAALRTEIDHAVAELLLSAEGAITDAFAHDPGPRVRDIERRIHSLHGSTAHDAKAAP